MDSRPVGIALIVLILSTTAVVTLAVMRREPYPVVMLQNNYPERLTRIEIEGKRFSFSHAFFARSDIAQLEIRICLLHSTQVPNAHANGTDENCGSFLDIDIPRSYLGLDEIPLDELEVEVDRDGEGRSIQICDASRAIQPYSSPVSTDSLYSVFGRTVNGSGGAVFLRGISDFFYERERNIEYLVVARGNREDSFSSTGTVGATIRDAPKGGTVIIDNVKKGEMVHVEFSIIPRPEHMPERTWNKNYDREFYQVIRAYADGELVVAKANRIEVELS